MRWLGACSDPAEDALLSQKVILTLDNSRISENSLSDSSILKALQKPETLSQMTGYNEYLQIKLFEQTKIDHVTLPFAMPLRCTNM